MPSPTGTPACYICLNIFSIPARNIGCRAVNRITLSWLFSGSPALPFLAMKGGFLDKNEINTYTYRKSEHLRFEVSTVLGWEVQHKAVLVREASHALGARERIEHCFDRRGRRVQAGVLRNNFVEFSLANNENSIITCIRCHLILTLPERFPLPPLSKQVRLVSHNLSSLIRNSISSTGKLKKIPARYFPAQA